MRFYGGSRRDPAIAVETIAEFLFGGAAMAGLMILLYRLAPETYIGMAGLTQIRRYLYLRFFGNIVLAAAVFLCPLLGGVVYRAIKRGEDYLSRRFRLIVGGVLAVLVILLAPCGSLEFGGHAYQQMEMNGYRGLPLMKVGAMILDIEKDMNLVYDLKMYDPDVHTNNKELEEWGFNNYHRMSPSQRQQWDRHYKPIIAKFKRDSLSGRALAEWKYQRYMHDYCRVITSIDRNVGRVIQYLKDNGLLDNTMIVYTSDQGFYMGEHGFFDKRFMYEESFRTPLLVYLPGAKHADISEMVQNIDYAPTFLQLAGVKVPSDIQGVSLLPLLQRKNPKTWRHSLYYHYYEYPAEHSVCRHYGVRTGRYSLMHFYNDIDEWELFDLKTDPEQMHNIYGRPGTEKLTLKLKKELLRLQEQYDDPIRFKYK